MPLKTTLSKVLCAALLGIFITSFASCGKCGGCDEIATTEGATVAAYDPYLMYSTKIIYLKVSEFYSTRKGDRNCSTKDLKICASVGLEKNLLTLKCNKELKLKTRVILPNNNFMDLAITSKEAIWGDVFTLELPLSDSFASGDYTFILGGTTKEGKTVNDTAIITY